MSETAEKNTVARGGEFLIQPIPASDFYIPENHNDEYNMIESMVKDFVKNEILPKEEDIVHKKDWKVTEDLLRKMGELGLLGIHMPEEYGGMAMDPIADTIVSENLGGCSSFNVSVAAHTGIGMLPILYFGTDAQKEKYLPQLITGEMQASYCLTEPTSGSDALSAKSTAILNEAGTHYILNGQKMWITNAGFSDVYIVFAQEAGKNFTGFIVEASTPGIRLGEEEKKLGINGSSTRQIFFEDVQVPKENLLGEIGKGHLIAFNVLNIGRFKLGVMCIGGCKNIIDMSVAYANDRVQFKQPISAFGAIKHKIAQQSVLVFKGESAMFYIADLLAKKSEELMSSGSSYAEAKKQAAEEYAIECAIEKVLGSEILDYVVDENVQIHGGMGYSEEMKAAQAFRDARINRIFEGTNEINRLLIVDMLLKRALKGMLDITGPAWDVQKELTKMPSMTKPEGRFGYEEKAVQEFKKLALMVMGAAAKMQMDGELDLEEEQEILMNGADLLIETFAAETTLLRTKKLWEMDHSKKELAESITRVVFHETNQKMIKIAQDAVSSFATGDLLQTFAMGIKRFTGYPLQNTKELRRKIAAHQIDAGKYAL